MSAFERTNLELAKQRRDSCPSWWLSITVLVLLCPFLLVVAGTAVAEKPAQAPANPSVETAARSTESEPRPNPTNPMVEAIRQRLEEESRQLEQLYTELELAADESAAMMIQYKIHETKKSCEIDILQIQLDFAVKHGRQEQAEQIRQSIEQLKMPPQKQSPSDGSAARRSDPR